MIMMRRLLAAVLLLACSAALAQAQPGQLPPDQGDQPGRDVLIAFAVQEPRPLLDRMVELSLLGVEVGAGGYDLYSTGLCRGRGTCRELNPLLRWCQDRSQYCGPLKMVLTGVTMYSTHKLWHAGKKGKVAAVTLAVGSTTLWTLAAHRNRQLYPQR